MNLRLNIYVLLFFFFLDFMTPVFEGKPPSLPHYFWSRRKNLTLGYDNVSNQSSKLRSVQIPRAIRIHFRPNIYELLDLKLVDSTLRSLLDVLETLNQNSHKKVNEDKADKNHVNCKVEVRNLGPAALRNFAIRQELINVEVGFALKVVRSLSR